MHVSLQCCIFHQTVSNFTPGRSPYPLRSQWRGIKILRVPPVCTPHVHPGRLNSSAGCLFVICFLLIESQKPLVSCLWSYSSIITILISAKYTQQDWRGEWQEGWSWNTRRSESENQSRKVPAVLLIIPQSACFLVPHDFLHFPFSLPEWRCCTALHPVLEVQPFEMSPPTRTSIIFPYAWFLHVCPHLHLLSFSFCTSHALLPLPKWLQRTKSWSAIRVIGQFSWRCSSGWLFTSGFSWIAN